MFVRGGGGGHARTSGCATSRLGKGTSMMCEQVCCDLCTCVSFLPTEPWLQVGPPSWSGFHGAVTGTGAKIWMCAAGYIPPRGACLSQHCTDLQEYQPSFLKMSIWQRHAG